MCGVPAKPVLPPCIYVYFKTFQTELVLPDIIEPPATANGGAGGDGAVVAPATPGDEESAAAEVLAEATVASSLARLAKVARRKRAFSWRSSSSFLGPYMLRGYGV